MMSRARGIGLLAAFALVAGDILHAEFAEHIAAALQLFIDSLEHAKREFAVGLDGDDAGVRQALFCVALELDALFEIDEVELDLLGRTGEREIRDDDVEERRFAGTGFACEERVLAGAFADGEKLVLGRAGAPDGDLDFAGRLVLPQLAGRGSDLREGDFDPVRVDARLADLVDKFRGEFVRGRSVESDPGGGFGGRVFDDQFAARTCEQHAALPQFIGHEAVRHFLPVVPMDEGEDAAARAAGGDALQPARGVLAEAGWEIGDDQEVVFFRDAARLLVVFGDARVLVAQIHLDHLFDVLAEFGETFVDLVALRPDASVDERFLVVGEVHESREILAEADGVDDGESYLARRAGGKEAEDDVVERTDDGRGAGLRGFEEQRTFLGNGKGKGQRKLFRAREGAGAGRAGAPSKPRRGAQSGSPG